MSVDLTGIPIRRAVPMPYLAGGVLEAALGSAMLQINRMGDRWSWTFETALIDAEPDGRQWQARLNRAAREGALLAIEQPGFNVGSPGAPVIAANTATGRFVPLSGLTPRYAIRAGQWLSIVAGGRRYLDSALDEVIVNASGQATIELTKLIRIPLTAGMVVELSQPKIEGVLSGDYTAPLELDRGAVFSFTITEQR